MEKRKDLSIREVISTNQEFYHLIQKDIQEMVSGEKEKIQQRQFVLPLAYPDFQDLFVWFGNYCLSQRNQNTSFVIDEDNEPVIEQLYYFVTNNPSFSGDLSKGIMLQGKYGCGKTLILETYSLLHNYVVRKFSLNHPLFTFIKSVELQQQIISQSVSMFVRRPLIIDELAGSRKRLWIMEMSCVRYRSY